MIRAVVTGFLCGKILKGQDAFKVFKTGSGRTDPRSTQRGLSKDGCSYVVKESHRFLETVDALSPCPLSPESLICLKLDITEFFPSADRQVLFDMLACEASGDYPHTSIKKGDQMPSHPCFCTVLPLAAALCGKKSLLPSFHSSRGVAYVPFTTGVSQGDGTGSFGAALEAHFATSQALVHYPNEDINILKIMDENNIFGSAEVSRPLYITLSAILLVC